jgi:cell wall-associated NlpC family hydrolase
MRILRPKAVTRPTAAMIAQAKTTLPVRRVASPVSTNARFANVLQTATAPKVSRPGSTATRTGVLPKPLKAPKPVTYSAAMVPAGGPAALSRSDMISKAESLMGIPYVWGGNTDKGLDCSAFVSKVWGVSRQTTDTLHTVARSVSRDELKAGDALNLTTARDEDGAGHVRLFDRWANAEKTKMWVYEETLPKSLHRVIDWDPSYTPMRRLNTVDA